MYNGIFLISKPPSSRASLGANLSGVVMAGPQTPGSSDRAGGSDTLLVQSRQKGPTPIRIMGDVTVPARSEMIVDGKVGRNFNLTVGMMSY